MNKLSKNLSGLFLLISGVLFAPESAFSREITYPDGWDIVIDITAAPYNADPTGNTDVADAIEAAVADAIAEQGPAGIDASPIVYFPNGRYLIGRPVVLETETPGGQWRMLQGQSKEGVVLFCEANDPDFQNVNDPRALVSFFEGSWTNNAFTNLFENFTVEVGAGNPGAVGVRFHGNNVARLENVDIISLDPEGTGAIGLDLKESISAPGIIEDVLIQGFDIGIDIANPGTSAQAWTIDDITTEGQLVVGIQSHRKAVQIIDWNSVNTVPAFISKFRDGMVTLINSNLRVPEGESSNETAITMNGDFLYLRNVDISGYALEIDDNGVEVPELGEDGSYRNGPTYKLIDEAKDGFAEIPILEIPTVPWDDPEDWVVVDPRAQEDDTEALQLAMDSGASTVFLYPGNFELTDTIYIGPKVQRVASNWARISPRGGFFGSGKPIFVWEETEHDIVIMERLAADWTQNGNEYMLHNATSADLVLSSNFWVGGGVYRNEPTEGRLFLEDVHNVPGGQVFRSDLASWIIVNQETWARQYNPEMALPLLTVDGGTFSVSGFKFGEQQGPVIIAKNQAVAEFLGGYMNVTHGVPLEPEEVPMIVSHDSQVSIRLIERAVEHSGPTKWHYRHEVIAEEVRNGETFHLLTEDPMVIHRDTMARFGPGTAGAMVPLYTSILNPDLYTNNTAPTITAAASSKAGVNEGAVLIALASDSDGPADAPAVHWRKLSGPGAAYFDDAASAITTVTASKPGVYTFEATANDGLLKVDSNIVEVEFVAESGTVAFDGDYFKRLTDLADRDGVADTALSSIYLYAGDFSVSGSTAEQEIRLHMERDIKKWTGAQGDIQSATLHITPKLLKSAPSIELIHVSENLSGKVSKVDFPSIGSVVATLNPENLTIRENIEIDVTEEFTASLERGDANIGFQLRSLSGPNDDGVSNFIEFFGASPTGPDYGPKLTIRVASSVNPGFLESIATFADGNGFIQPLDYVVNYENGWVYSYSLQRFLYFPQGATLSSMWTFAPGIGWAWTNKDFFPFLYDYTGDRWLQAMTNQSGYQFYDYKAQEWIQLIP